MMQKKARCLRERLELRARTRRTLAFISSSRSGQAGLNAAILVAIIAGLIILYIVFLPAAEREKLVGENGATSTVESPNLLLKVFPGMLSTTSGLENEKSIPNVFLVETTNAKELQGINPFIIRNGWFDKATKKIDFGVDDVDNTDNVAISFGTKKRTGILTIKLNGAVIFENELSSGATEPVKLEKRLLGKTNTLEFSVSSVGVKFWTTNEYSFENIKIIGDITDTSKQQSTNIFTLSNSEFASMSQATLKFTPYCSNVNNIGTLDIFVNNKKLFSAVPVCNNAYKQSVPKSALNEGENNIVFKTGKGSYSVEQIKVALDLKEPKLKTYYFEISDATLKKINSGSQNVLLTLKFVDSSKRKRLKMDVSGHLETVETEKLIFTEKINSKVSSGNNFVRLEPFEDVEVAELRVELS